MRTIALLIVLAVALLAYWMPEHARPNGGLPVVNAAVPMFPPRPVWRLYTSCPIDRRNVPIVEDRKA